MRCFRRRRNTCADTTAIITTRTINRIRCIPKLLTELQRWPFLRAFLVLLAACPGAYDGECHQTAPSHNTAGASSAALNTLSLHHESAQCVTTFAARSVCDST